MSEFILQSFVTLLVIVNPFSVVPIFVSLTEHDTIIEKNRIAKKACTISIVLLLLFAFAGDTLLTIMEISPAAFRITGGFLLLLAAINMVVAKKEVNKCDASDPRDDISVFPLSIPLLAGPGALTTVVLLMKDAGKISIFAQMSVIVVVFTVVIISFICLIVGNRLMRILGVTGTNVLTRVFGIILSSVSINNIIKGVIEVVKMARVA